MATLKERIDADLKDAMRAKDEIKLSTLRMMKSTIKYKEVEPGASLLDDAQILGVLATLVKQRRESIEQFRAGKRDDLADKEEKEIAVIQLYMPQQLTAAELTAEVAKAIAEAKATSAKDMGAVMKVASPRLKGKAEGKAISDEVKAQLAKLG
ncbi:MAG: transamidase GatB domain protein [Myxococcaceae bacterium]|nr:transamidase GatB domain protein [Myxococcaceae bacterium]